MSADPPPSAVSSERTNSSTGSTTDELRRLGADGQPLGPRVVLVGPPGAGKSSVGRKLAERLRLSFCDTDEVVAERAGKPVADIFVDDGEAAFRALERDVVAESLATCSGVLSLGGGAVLASETRALLSHHLVVFLDVGLSAAAARIGLGAGRPLLLGNVRGQLKALLDARRPVYVDIATSRVLTDDRTVDEVAAAVEQLLTSAEPDA
jgi:shikimate kinase